MGFRRTDVVSGSLAWTAVLLASFALPAGGEETVASVSPFEIVGESVDPGQSRRLELSVSESFTGSAVPIPLTVLHGSEPGPSLCLTAGVHGDEINGVEVVRRAVDAIPTEGLRGTVIAVPIVNLHGFRRGSRYLPDRRDLNRFFPGRSRGSSASRIAHSLFVEIVRRCDFLLDFHTGSFQRDNLPHVRADLSDAGVRRLAEALTDWIVLDHPGTEGTLRRAASQAGVPTLTFEVGGPWRVEEEVIARGLEGVESTLRGLGMRAGARQAGGPQVMRRSSWVRVDEGGVLFSDARLGQLVEGGTLLGWVVDPLSSQRSDVRAPRRGRVIGMAWNQVVIPGFAAFHLVLPDDAPVTAGEEPIGPTHDDPEEDPE